jgi:hypothetical protein
VILSEQARFKERGMQSEAIADVAGAGAKAVAHA